MRRLSLLLAAGGIVLAGITAFVSLQGCHNDIAKPGDTNAGAPPGGFTAAPPVRRTHAPEPPRPMPKPARAIWVARMHYEHPDDIRTIIRNCAALGFNTIEWQVRGNGTVGYRSQIEPFFEEYGYRDPGFDPLELAIEEAHARGLRIEAWFNVMPGWKGDKPPALPNQLYNAHPDWFMYDDRGRRQDLNEHYVIVNPCLPEVRAYIAALAGEVAGNYDIDGLHLDYIRYAWDKTPNAQQRFPGDARTLGLYRRETGKSPSDDRRAWDAWRAAQLTQLVAEIRRATQTRRPGATLTAAVWGSADRGYRDYFQNGGGWLRAGLLDAIMPMAYTPRSAEFVRDIAAYQRLAPGGHIIPGVGIYLCNQPGEMAAQLQQCRSWGGDYCLFSYDSLHATADDRRAGKVEEKQAQLRTMRRSVLSGSLAEGASDPVATSQTAGLATETPPEEVTAGAP